MPLFKRRKRGALPCYAINKTVLQGETKAIPCWLITVDNEILDYTITLAEAHEVIDNEKIRRAPSSALSLAYA